MKKLSLFALLCITVSCSQKKEQLAEKQLKHEPENYTDLSFLCINDTMNLDFRNEKCGEWGGDQQSILIYKEKGDILLDVTESVMNCDSIEKYIDQPLETSFEKRRVKIDASKLKLVSEAIEELINLQMHFNGENLVSHSGCASGIRLSSKRFYLYLYPSPKWNKFNKLFKVLKSERKSH